MEKLQSILEKVWHYLPLEQIFIGDKRIFWPFLLLSGLYIVIFALFYGFEKIKIKPSSWFGRSAGTDYCLWTINHVIQVAILPVSFGNGLLFAVRIDDWLASIFGVCKLGWEVTNYTLLVYGVALMIVMDFARYIVHWALHNIPILIPIHMIHHHAEVLTPITLFRVHPFEMILSQIRYLFVYGILTGIFMYIYNDTITMPQVFGVSMIVFLSNVLASNLRHTHIPLSFGLFEWICISPKQHQMHHAKNHAHEVQNLGSMFAIWDVLFKTWRSSVHAEISDFGVRYKPKQSVWTELYFPILIWVKLIKRNLPRKKK